jgi:hypothetical protein
MADMELWTENSKLSNFADDTQSIVISDKKEKAIETTKTEANSVISFFENNNLVNNADKAAMLYNSRGKGDSITVEDIGGEQIKSTKTEKLLGLHINSDFEWNNHIFEISIDLKKRIGLLRRIRQRIPKSKLIMIAEAIFNSKIRYGAAVYLVPVFDKEDLKWKKQSKETYALQTLQNTMIRVIHGLKQSQHINMKKLREKINMMSVNQMAVYHTILETFNIIRKSSSEQIKLKYTHQKHHSQRSTANNALKVPEKAKKKCTGFSYNGAKIYNMLPSNIKETENPTNFKTMVKAWIWNNIPSNTTN